jgi:NAD/NADP transhydrogenase beta subunit
MHRPCWLHSWATLRATGAKEWSTWLGIGVIIGGAVAVIMADSAALTEWAKRIGIVSPIVGGALIWLRQQRPGDKP